LLCVWVCAVTDGAKSSITTTLAVSNTNIFLTRHLPKDSLPHSTVTLSSTHILNYLSGMSQGAARTTWRTKRADG